MFNLEADIDHAHNLDCDVCKPRRIENMTVTS